MSALDSHVRAFGGSAALEGDNLVRIVYMDEGGISHREPIVVVSGVLVNADRSLVALEDRLQEIANKHIPEPDNHGFVFHATNIWSGTKYFKDKSFWTRFKRLAILDDLVQIPASLEIPIIYGTADKAGLRPAILNAFSRVMNRQPTEQEIDAEFHSLAFLECVTAAESILRRWPTHEVGMLIAENRESVRRWLKQTHSWLRDDSEFATSIASKFGLDLPLRKLRDSIYFAEKSESRPLQLADVCAFVLRGHFERRDYSARFIEPMRQWIWFARGDNASS